MIKLLAVAVLALGLINDRPLVVVAGLAILFGDALYRRDWPTVAIFVLALPLVAGAWAGWTWTLWALPPLLLVWLIWTARRDLRS